MTPSFEQMLFLGAVGFYMLDSAMLLYCNEIVLIQTKKRWMFSYPGPRWQILGKILYVPNPLTPNSSLFRVFWSVSGFSEHNEDQEALQHFLDALKTLQHLTIVLLALLIVGLPVVLFGFGTGWGFLLLLGIIYTVISAMLILSYRKRKELQLPGKFLIKLAFDSLVCAPFALNLVRKITLRRYINGDPICFAKQVFDDATFDRLVKYLFNRVDEELESEDMESPQYSALKDYRNRIASMSS